MSFLSLEHVSKRYRSGEVATDALRGRLTTAGKFIYYSLTATVIGLITGLFSGMLLLPRFIFQAYSILYDLPSRCSARSALRFSPASPRSGRHRRAF